MTAKARFRPAFTPVTVANIPARDPAVRMRNVSPGDGVKPGRVLKSSVPPSVVEPEIGGKNLTIDPSAVAPQAGISNVQIKFTVEIDGLNEPQTISAPSNPKPLDQLFSDAGIDPSVLGGLSGAGGLGSSSSGSGSSSGADYMQCVQQANTTAEINACASQL